MSNSLKSILTEYISNTDKTSLAKSYPNSSTTEDNLSLEMKNELFNKFNMLFIAGQMPSLFNCRFQDIVILAGGTQGVVIKVTSPNVRKGVDNLKNTQLLFRENEFNLNAIPNEMAIKIQMFPPKNKYWEARALREEKIMSKLNTSPIQQHIPTFYYGCTIHMPHNNEYIKFRLTFMDVIDSRYVTIQTLLEENIELQITVFEKIKSLVMSLWKIGVSHNDLSMRNIMINRRNHNDIKIVDFGLSQYISEGISDEEQYMDHFKGLSNQEQSGSNVVKLQELKALFNSTA